jgi:hypothetical protein
MDTPSPQRDTHLWTHFAKLHVMVSVTFHSISTWLTVYLACFRCIYLASAQSSACGVQKSSSIHHKSSQRKNEATCCSKLAYAFQRCMLTCRTYTCTLVGIINICLFCILFCFPAYLYPTVRERIFNNSNNDSLQSTNVSSKDSLVYYLVDQSDLDIKTEGLIFKVMFYTQAIFGKFVPCLLLTTFSTIIIKNLIIINRNKKRLNKKISRGNKKVQNQSCLTKPFRHLIARLLVLIPNKYSQTNLKKSAAKIDEDLTLQLNKKDERRLSEIKETILDEDAMKKGTNELNKLNAKQEGSKKAKTLKRTRASENLRTTLMLTIVCILFLMTEFPQSISLFLALFNYKRFYQNAYVPLGDLFDIIALINNSINFLLYCSMSRAFRNTLYKLVVDSWCYKCFKSNDATKKRAEKQRVNTTNFSRFADDGKQADVRINSINNTYKKRNTNNI